MNNELLSSIAQQLSIPNHIVANVLDLLADGNTVHFLARYRKEVIGGLDEEAIRLIEKQYLYKKQLTERKEVIKSRLLEQDLLTAELQLAIDNCDKLVQLEQLYEPYKSKKVTKAKLAIQGGLEPLAQEILRFGAQAPELLAAAYVNETFPSVAEVLENVNYLVAQMISERLDLREALKRFHLKRGTIKTTAKKNVAEKDPDKTYTMYYDFSRQLSVLADHQILALNRAEAAKVISVSFQVDDERILAYTYDYFITTKSYQFEHYFSAVIKDALKRLMLPSIQREIRSEFTQRAETQAIRLFGGNVYQLLMQKPLKKQTILGLDPAFRTGCKLAVVDELGKVAEIAVIYPHAPQNKSEAAEEVLNTLFATHHFSIIAIGNGTASRESEAFIAQWIEKQQLPLQYTIVNEAGASVYSASKLAISEFPDLSVEQRSAISLVRRLQDPLAELVKIDPQALGVGQYQHDLPKKALAEELEYIVNKAVNTVGVDINSASAELLRYVSGLTKTTAAHIVQYRESNGAFMTRAELLKVKGFGKKAYEQAAGFLRVIEGTDCFDNTAIHPESYAIAQALLQRLGLTKEDIGSEEMVAAVMAGKPTIVKEAADLADSYTIESLLEAFLHPFRDARDNNPTPVLRQEVQSIEDLFPGIELQGIVRNITDFGAFIDIGIKNDGFVHISKISPKFLSHPTDALAIGDIKTVFVEAIDSERQKVELTLLPQH